MDKPKYVLDSTVVINHLNKKLDLDAFFDSIPEYEQYISIITEIEALSKYNMTSDDEKETLDLIDRFTIIEIIPPIKDAAIHIRRATRMKLPDAVIAATAIVLDAVVLTNDTGFMKVQYPGLRIQGI
jgi:predicted nucleic acid-binding protein